MTNSDQHGDEWAACPSGTLKQVAERMRGEQIARSRRSFSRATFAALALAVLGFGIVALQIQSSSPPGNLECHEVAALMAEFAAGNLDPTVADRVRIHLANCEQCRNAFQRTYPDYDLQVEHAFVPRRERVDRQVFCGLQGEDHILYRIGEMDPANAPNKDAVAVFGLRL